MLTTDSAADIMNALERLYGNEHEIIEKLVSAIRELPSLKQGKIDIVTFAATVKNNVAAILSVGHSGHLYYPELIQEVIQKVPQAMVYRYNEHVGRSSDPPGLSTLANFLTLEADLANRAGTARILGNTNRDSKVHQNKKGLKFDHGRNSKAVLSINNRDRSRSVQRENRCWYCNSSFHILYKCTDFCSLSVNEKWLWVRKERRCFKCLRSGHDQKSCTSSGCTINRCTRSHHTLLHPTNSSHNKSKVHQFKTNFENASLSDKNSS